LRFFAPHKQLCTDEGKIWHSVDLEIWHGVDQRSEVNSKPDFTPVDAESLLWGKNLKMVP